tara:strand:+ start:4657 stop:6282 length:1626 start_codon:yes stop_codon:yes gene_type:complete
MLKEKNLIILKSNKSIELPSKFNGFKIYTIGAGQIKNLKLKSINNNNNLNKLAEKYRDEYSEWIFGINKFFLKHKLTYENNSLLFFTDLFAKRTELFNTYNYFINFKIIESYIKKNKIKKIYLISDDQDFSEILTNLKNVKIKKIYTFKSLSKKFLFIKSVIYFSKIFLISLSNLFSRKKYNKNNSENIFLSRYPLHFKILNKKIIEDKFTDKVKRNDKFAVSIITDDFHQNVSVYEYFKFKNELKSNKFYLIDKHISLYDLFKTLYEIIGITIKWKRLLKKKYIFANVDISNLITLELKFSFHRVIRLLILHKSTKKFVDNINIKKFYYYLHEYPYGKMITSVLVRRSINHTALQHGPSSMRKLVYFLSKSDISDDNFLKFSPKPYHTLAEEEFSKKIYQKSNFLNVEVMEKIHRLNYLKKFKNGKKKFILIAPGLHDGQLLLTHAKEIMKKDPNELFLLKPHPRANNQYLKDIAAPNLKITYQPVHQLYKNAKKVICSYSSVGYEAKLIGIEFDIVKISGIIDESPLLDKNFKLNKLNL